MRENKNHENLNRCSKYVTVENVHARGGARDRRAADGLRSRGSLSLFSTYRFPSGHQTTT